MEYKANASDLLRSCVELCTSAAGWLQAAFRFYVENIEFITLGLLFYISRSQSYIKRIWSHWVYAAMFFGVTNLMADKEVTVLSSQCIFLSHLLIGINKLTKKIKKYHCALWSYREPITVLNYMSMGLDALSSWALKRSWELLSAPELHQIAWSLCSEIQLTHLQQGGLHIHN